MSGSGGVASGETVWANSQALSDCQVSTEMLWYLEIRILVYQDKAPRKLEESEIS